MRVAGVLLNRAWGAAESCLVDSLGGDELQVLTSWPCSLREMQTETFSLVSSKKKKTKKDIELFLEVFPTEFMSPASSS